MKAPPQQMRAAIECLPFEAPKLSAVTVAALTGESLQPGWTDEASNRAKLIEGRAIEVVETSDAKGLITTSFIQQISVFS